MLQGLQIKLCKNKSMSPCSSDPQTLMRRIARGQAAFFYLSRTHLQLGLHLLKQLCAREVDGCAV